MNLPAGFAFSATSLQHYADCPRRFELRYLKRMRSPALEALPALEYERQMRQGNRFHQLAQQHSSGVEAAVLACSLADDAALVDWWRNYMAEGLLGLPEQGRYAQIVLQTYLADCRLSAKYDLLALDKGGAAVIVDWKTGPRVPSRSYLAWRWQTVVYRYVLAQAGAHLYGGPIPPERIRMDYFYVAVEGERRVSLDYSAAQLDEDEVRLQRILEAIKSRIQAADAFPLTTKEKRCRFCSYRAFCDRGEPGRFDDLEFAADETDEMEEADFALDFGQIAEIEF